jgi:hypothetical protein
MGNKYTGLSRIVLCRSGTSELEAFERELSLSRPEEVASVLADFVSTLANLGYAQRDCMGLELALEADGWSRDRITEAIPLPWRVIMNLQFKRWDRVRVRRPRQGYEVGDKGTVLEGPDRFASPDENTYVVMMDKDGPGSTTTVFKADEIEVDD